jgi:hypothetical protein
MPRVERLPKAMEYLTKVPRQSEWFPHVALAIAHDKFFEAKSPSEAEAIIDEALRVWPNDVELNSWKIRWLTVNNAAELAEPYFLAGANTSKLDAQRLERLLRTWLKSQFFPEDLESEFDRQLGAASLDEATNDTIRLERWTTLRRWDLSQPKYDAALALWYLRRGFMAESLEQLRHGQTKAEERPDPSFLAVSVQAFCDTGQVEVAARILPLLQSLSPGYLTHLSEARIALAHEQTDQAVTSLVAARGCWPGPIDPWLSQVLERLYRQKDDESSRAQAEMLAADREWLSANLVNFRQILSTSWGVDERAKLAEILGRLNRQVELDILKSWP